MNELADDTGVANERTALAWRRSAISLLAVAVVMVHRALEDGLHPQWLAATLALALGAAAVQRHGRRLYDLRAADGHAHVAYAARGLAGLSGMTLVAAAVVIAAIGSRL